MMEGQGWEWEGRMMEKDRQTSGEVECMHGEGMVGVGLKLLWWKVATSTLCIMLLLLIANTWQVVCVCRIVR